MCNGFTPLLPNQMSCSMAQDSNERMEYDTLCGIWNMFNSRGRRRTWRRLKRAWRCSTWPHLIYGNITRQMSCTYNKKDYTSNVMCIHTSLIQGGVNRLNLESYQHRMRPVTFFGWEHIFTKMCFYRLSTLPQYMYIYACAYTPFFSQSKRTYYTMRTFIVDIHLCLPASSWCNHIHLVQSYTSTTLLQTNVCITSSYGYATYHSLQYMWTWIRIHS